MEAPTVTMWIAIAIAIAIPIYPIAYGPFIFAVYGGVMPPELCEAGSIIFMPLEDATLNGPRWLMCPFADYLNWWSEQRGVPYQVGGCLAIPVE
jgi:hypothetical protein